MLGAYYLPVAYLAHETGLTPERASAALGRACATGFAEYDDATEYVWVPNLAREQVGAVLKPGDKRRKGIVAELQKLARHAFARRFFEKYGTAYGLSDDDGLGWLSDTPEGPSKGHPRGGEGAPKGLCPVPVPVPALVPDPDPEAAPEDILAAYDEARVGTDWPACRKITEKRAVAARALLHEIGIESVRDALQRARQSAFLTDPEVRNASPDHRTWRPDIDWFIQADTVTRILEGKYDTTTTAPRVGDTPERREKAAAELGCGPEDLHYEPDSDDYLLSSGGVS